MVNIKNDLSQGLEKLEKIAEFYNDHNWEPRKRNVCVCFFAGFEFLKMSCHVVLHSMHGGGQNTVFGVK